MTGGKYMLIGLIAAGMVPAVAAPQPDPESRALWNQVTLYRDAWGVPHIQAGNPRALAFAFGWAQAEDHLEPMLLAYRMAAGRAAEVLGEPMAASDAFAIQCGHSVVAGTNLGTADAVTRDLCEGFAAGVNAWMAAFPGKTPPWADVVEAPDILAFWHMLMTRMAPFDLPGAWRPPRPIGSANAWAMAPARTEENAAILVLNPHEIYDSPIRWYEAHLMLPDMNITGMTLFGLPVILQGFTPELGWALTPNRPDFADVFEERVEETDFDPENPDLMNFGVNQNLPLEYMAGARPYFVRTPEGMEERVIPRFIGPRGPVFDDGQGRFFSWRIGGFFETGGLRQLFDMARAGNLDVFQEMLLAQQIPCFHIVYADRMGNIFYLYNTASGTRMLPPPKDASMPLPDWRAPQPLEREAAAWGRRIPGWALPWIVNPESGFIQACGNPPWLATTENAIPPDAAPPWLIADVDTLRARHARQLLGAGRRSFRDNQAMLFDMLVPAAADLVPRLIAAADKQENYLDTTHPDVANGLELLRNWNYLADARAAPMTFFHVWWAMAAKLAGPAFTEDARRFDMLMSGTPEADRILLDAAADAARMMRNEFADFSLPWGAVHRIQRGGREEAVEGTGSGGAIFRMAAARYEADRWLVTSGYAGAMAVCFSDTPDAVSVNTFGASENPDSPHFDDQLDLFLEKRFRRLRYMPDQIQRHAATAFGSSTVLLPRGVEGAVSFLSGAPVTASLETLESLPAPLPAGIRAFTLPVRTRWEPEMLPLDLLIEFVIPESLCRPENLHRLKLYAHRETAGWTAVEEQKLDAETRLFAGLANRTAVFLAAGPAVCFEAPVRRTVPKPPGYTPPEPEEEEEAAPPTEAATGEKAPDAPPEDRVFRFEILNREFLEERKKTGEAEERPPHRPGSGRVFRLDRLDRPADAPPGIPETEQREKVEAPGEQPAAEAPEKEKAEQNRIFRMERLDEPDKQEEKKPRKRKKLKQEDLRENQTLIGGD
jgi:acyl-homoserine-lactone acylase